jgi:hypothetical protein
MRTQEGSQHTGCCVRVRVGGEHGMRIAKMRAQCRHTTRGAIEVASAGGSRG